MIKVSRSPRNSLFSWSEKDERVLLPTIFKQSAVIGGVYGWDHYVAMKRIVGLIIQPKIDVLVYKKVLKARSYNPYLHDGVVIAMAIEAGTPIRINTDTSKCRAAAAVFEGHVVTSRRNGTFEYLSDEDYLLSMHNPYRHGPKFVYEPGLIMPTQPQRQVLAGMKHGDECGPGIHFFFNQYDAFRYSV